MTISEFERRLKEIDPRFNIRQRGSFDVVGIFLGSKYLVRISKGELNLNGYKFMYFTDTLQRIEGNIVKRGRKTTVKMIHSLFPLSLKQKASLLYGVN